MSESSTTQKQLLAEFLQKKLGVPRKLVPAIIPYYKEEQLSRRESLLKEGDFCRKMYFIDSGYLRFFSYSGKKVITHWIFRRGLLVTDVASFFFQEQAKWNVEALTDTTVYSISYTDYQELRKNIVEWDNYEKLFLVRLVSALENRVYALVSMSSEERYQYLFNADREMFNELPLNFLASMLGITPETLSRIRRKFMS